MTENDVNDGAVAEVIRSADDVIKSGSKNKRRNRRKKPRQVGYKQVGPRQGATNGPSAGPGRKRAGPRKNGPPIETAYGKGFILTKRKRKGIETLKVKLDFGILYMPAPVKRRQIETPYGTGEVLRKRQAKGGHTMLTVQIPFGVLHTPDPLDSKKVQTDDTADKPVEKKSKRKRKKKGKQKLAEKKGAAEETKTPEKKSRNGRKKAPKDPAKEIPQETSDPIDINFLKAYIQKNQEQRDKELALLQKLIGK